MSEKDLINRSTRLCEAIEPINNIFLLMVLFMSFFKISISTPFPAKIILFGSILKFLMKNKKII